ncbi:MAG: tryptophan--tRNA ligase [Saprospirales bacterium]|nr:MAG: tryptophan--tRNA ligase [Saprospirales bacterium]
MSEKKRILSGVQPTGNLHLGRYLGAIRNWVGLQDDYQCFYSVVNYHAITMPYKPKKLREQSWDLVYRLLACGIKEENLFIQSLVPEHTELAWILNCNTSYGELGRMTQFKDKSQQVRETDKDMFISAGLFTYPVLQAADILIYKPSLVPVGKDQEQHLELTRNIAQRFNNVVGNKYFQLPEPLFTRIPKVMSTADPSRKMSASLGEKHNIDLFADEKRIVKQIKSAVTDSGEVKPDTMSPGIANLFNILWEINPEVHGQFLEDYKKGNLQYGVFKEGIAESLINYLKPIRERFEEIQADKKQIRRRVKDSSEEIRKVAAQTLSEVKELSGLL